MYLKLPHFLSLQEFVLAAFARFFFSACLVIPYLVSGVRKLGRQMAADEFLMCRLCLDRCFWLNR